MTRVGLGLLVGLGLVSSAWSHEVGCDGKPVPTNVRLSCCGAADAHLLNDTDWPLPHEDDQGDWHIVVDGHEHVWSRNEIIPSSDGCYWGFWKSYGSSMAFFCLLVPMDL